MAARRHDNTPPFEIMGNTSSKPAVSGRGPRPGGGIGGFGQSVIDAWRDGTNEPLLLRVPRGMALCLLAGMLGLLILAYWVGYSRGDSAAEKRVTAIYEPHLTGDDRQPPDRPGTTGVGDTGQTGAGNVDSGGSGAVSAQNPAQTAGDPRTPGLNYLILSTCPYEEALRLQKFLAGRQVDVMIGPRNNKGLCQVITLKGFTRQAYRDTDGPERFMTQMRALGRDWKAANGGRGDDLGTMNYAKYKPND